jgi:hypothetical protein
MSSPINHTSVDPQALIGTANRIGQLMDDMSVFEKLASVQDHLRVGNFDTAEWLKQIIDDRINGVIAHARDLKTAFGDIQTSLEAVSRDFQATDADNSTLLQRELTHDVNVMNYNVGHDASGVSPGVHNVTPPTETGFPSRVTSGNPPGPYRDPTDEVIGQTMETALATHHPHSPAPPPPSNHAPTHQPLLPEHDGSVSSPQFRGGSGRV